MLFRAKSTRFKDAAMSRYKAPEELREENLHFSLGHLLAVRLNLNYRKAREHYFRAREKWVRAGDGPGRYDEFRFVPGIPREIEESEEEYRLRVYQELRSSIWRPDNFEKLVSPESLVLVSHREAVLFRFGLLSTFSCSLPEPISILDFDGEDLRQTSRKLWAAESEERVPSEANRVEELRRRRERVEKITSIESAEYEKSLILTEVFPDDGAGACGDPLDDFREDDEALFRWTTSVAQGHIGAEILYSSTGPEELEQMVWSPRYPVLPGKTVDGRYFSLLSDDERIGTIYSLADHKRRFIPDGGTRKTRHFTGIEKFQTEFVPLFNPSRTRGASRDLKNSLRGSELFLLNIGGVLAALNEHRDVGEEFIESFVERVLANLGESGASDSKDAAATTDGESAFGLFEVGGDDAPSVEAVEATAKKYEELLRQKSHDSDALRPIFDFAIQFDKALSESGSAGISRDDLERVVANIGTQRVSLTGPDRGKSDRYRNHDLRLLPDHVDRAYTWENRSDSDLLKVLITYAAKFHPDLPDKASELATEFGLCRERVLESDRQKVSRALDAAKKFVDARDRWRNLEIPPLNPLALG